MIKECEGDAVLQVWDLLSEGGKKEVELVKATSGAGFNVPDLAQAGEPMSSCSPSVWRALQLT